MPVCGRIPKKKKTYCVGDLNVRIELLTRSMDSSGLDLDEDFDVIDTVWARMETDNKSTEFFDGVDLTNSYTHKPVIRYRADITSENWFRFEDKIYRILNTENIDEEGRWLRLKAIKKGSEATEANRA